MSSRSSSEPGIRPTNLTSFGPRGEGWVGLQTALGLAVLWSAPLTARAWTGEPATIVALVGIAIVVVGIGLFVLGAVTLGATFSIWIKPRPGGHLARHGIYRWMRHPVCTAQVLIGIGWGLLWASPLSLLLVVVYVWYLDRYKLAIEERWLDVTYPQYRAYREAVPHRMIAWPPRRRAEGG